MRRMPEFLRSNVTGALHTKSWEVVYILTFTSRHVRLCCSLRCFLITLFVLMVIIGVLYYVYFYNSIRIVFIGDSLVYEAEIEYGLLDRIYEQLQPAAHPYHLRIINSGVNADTIADIYRRLWFHCYIYFPHAIVLFWDSDVSNYEEAAMSPDELKGHRLNYRTMLHRTLDRLRDHSEYTLVTGPALYGELPRGQNIKDKMVEEYLAMNKNASFNCGVEYLDSRTPLIAVLPKGWGQTNLTGFLVINGLAGGFLTIDGEHFNRRGTDIMADLISERLIFWMKHSGKRKGNVLVGF